MGNGIFRENCKSKTVNHFRNTMVDFRIKVARTSSKNDTASTGYNKLFEGFFCCTLGISVLIAIYSGKRA